MTTQSDNLLFTAEDFKHPELPWTSFLKPSKAAEMANAKAAPLIEENARLWKALEMAVYDLGLPQDIEQIARLREALEMAIKGGTLECTACDGCGLCSGCEQSVRAKAALVPRP